LLLTSVLVITPNISISASDEGIHAEPVTNIILFIGDGMGYEHVKLAQWVEVGVNGVLPVQNLTVTANVTTYCLDNPVTDSAAAATAIATGVKTNYGYVGLGPTGDPLENIVDIAKSLGKSTGLISTVTSTHATPASFYAHHDNRYEYDVIEAQMIDSGIDVILGGGSGYYSAGQISTMESYGYDVVYNKNELLATPSNKIFGLLAPGYMDIEIDRVYTASPSIKEMTAKAIDTLDNDADGFFLMVEAGQIDLESHDWNLVSTAVETIAFLEAVSYAIDYAKGDPNTLVIVTADHETGGLSLTGNNLNDTLPADRVAETDKRALRIARASNISATWGDDYHTAVDVPFFGFGSFFSDLSNNTIIDNSDIFEIMNDYYSDLPLIINEFTTMSVLVILPIIVSISLALYKKKKS
jgi:alkaline phosphatase